ncbi:receptor-like cytosolic serine/threonine-protein kinase RBK2 isoform X2 [Tripterygium wilfordii]|uniref:receptor-like cytosolic serine/threonine-protein kinase RBK2 isoform X2 n=1 Tax=Tripterygium wilfordii TaxID=458696 RepID=UPI0018F8624C|nr:receptor-like cytosolic serine/threonine-protein kinase RBK2 isoform X2 [Tripterygium wilfordii]
MATDKDSSTLCLLSRENLKDLDISQKNQQEEVNATKYKRRGSMPSSASAHDLRSAEMEKDSQDGSSPRGVLEAYLKGMESETGFLQNDTTTTDVHCSNSRAMSNWSRFFKIWKRRSTKNLPSFPPLAVPKLSKRKSRSTKENPVLRDIYNFKSTLQNFTLSELKTATNNFSPENIIGKGGYAEVYKGCLQNGKFIAIKCLTKGTPDERTAGFLSELGIIAHVDHPNTAKLIGVGIEGGMHLIFELSPLGSLGSLLHGSNAKIDWSKRYKIALGTADGLLYLHETCQKRIIHRDIKADNVLLTEDYEAQICDFGLAKWLPKECTHHNVSKFEGTFGYFAPEYFMHGIVDEKTDIYAFGVLLLELITGRQALDALQQNLVLWAKPLLDKNDIKVLVDPAIGEDYDPEEMDRMVLTASLCVEQSPILRPRMSQVVILLRGDEYVAECAKKNNRRCLQRTYSEELLDAQEYNSTRYLNDLSRHMEILGS